MARIHDVRQRREPPGGLSPAFLWLVALGIGAWTAIALVAESALRLAS